MLEGIVNAGVRGWGGLSSLPYFILKVLDYSPGSAFILLVPGLIDHNEGAGAAGIKEPF